MKEELISFETAKLAKEKEFGYDFGGTHYVDGFYSEDEIEFKEFEMQQEDAPRSDYYLRPTQSLLQKWLRETHDIFVTPMEFDESNKNFIYRIRYEDEKGLWCLHVREVYSKTYEEAFEIGLIEALKVIQTY